MRQWATGAIASHGTNLHCYRSGGSGPPLVLVHGISGEAPAGSGLTCLSQNIPSAYNGGSTI